MRFIFIICFFLIAPIHGITQNTTPIFQDEYVKVTFKKFDNKFAYLMEESDAMYGGTLIEYKIEGSDFILKEVDTMIILDSLLFYSDRQYMKDSVMLIMRVRINEFENGSMSYKHMKYIINDSLIFDGTKMYKDDDLHRVLIPKFNELYKLEIEAGNDRIGPFFVKSQNDICIKLIILATMPTFEFDYGIQLPKKIEFEGKKYNLKHNFVPWE